MGLVEDMNRILMHYYGIGGRYEPHLDALVSALYKHCINFANQHII